MRKAIFVLTLVLFACSCSKENNSENEDSLSFEEIEALFDMKTHFSEKSKNAIIEKYGTTNSYYEYSTKRFEELRVKNSINLSSKTETIVKVRLFNLVEGLDETIDCPNYRYVLDVAEEEGIDLPNSDRAGASSTCVAHLHWGEVDQDDQSFLTQEQMDLGYVLLCVAFPLNDCYFRTHQEDNLP